MAVVHFNLYDPAKSLFKSGASEKAEIQYVECRCTDCPLLKAGQCAANRFMGRCVYGKKHRETGYTRRASAYSKWIREKREQFKGVPYLEIPPNKMAFIGDYVYLPYAHMNNRDSQVVFKCSDFLPKEYWNIETVIQLINLRPRSLIGYEIPSYQQEQVPLFIQHLREVDPDMWRQLIEVRPDLDKTPNYVGRIAKLKTLNQNIKVKIKDVDYEWTGKELVCGQVEGLSWDFRLESDCCEIRIVPKDNYKIKVASNEWVNENTEFVD